MEVCESFAIICKCNAIVHGDWIAAMCKLLSFASVILTISLYCLALCYPWLWSRLVWLTEGMPLGPNATCFWEQGRGIRRELLEQRRPIVFGSWCGRSDGSSRFVTKTLRVCSGLVLTYYTWEQRLLLLSLERWPFINEINTDLRCKSTSGCTYQVQCPYPDSEGCPALPTAVPWDFGIPFMYHRVHCGTCHNVPDFLTHLILKVEHGVSHKVPGSSMLIPLSIPS